MAIKNFLYVFITILLCLNKVSSQNNLTFQQVENITYQYFQNSNWDSLINFGEEAINQQIDYFYLRIRLGYAYYSKKNYSRAIKHLKAAYKFNSTYPLLLELLYFSYLYTNQISESNYLIKTHKNIIQSKLIQDPKIKNVYIESSISSMLNNENTLLENANNNNLKWLENNKIKTINYTAFGTMLTFHKNLLTNFSYGNVILNNVKEILIEDDILDDHYSLYQHQIYLNNIFRISENKYLIPAFNLILVNYETLFSRFNKNEQKVYLNREKRILNDYAVSLTFRNRYSKSDLNINTTISKLNGVIHPIINYNFTLFPKGNLNLYFTTSASIQFKHTKHNLIFDKKIGFKLFNKLWLEQFLTFGKISNYVEQNAYVIHNSLDVCNFRTGTQVIFAVQKFHLSLRYLLALKSSPYSYFDNKPKNDKTDYIENNFFINLAWWF